MRNLSEDPRELREEGRSRNPDASRPQCEAGRLGYLEWRGDGHPCPCHVLSQRSDTRFWHTTLPQACCKPEPLKKNCCLDTRPFIQAGFSWPEMSVFLGLHPTSPLKTQVQILSPPLRVQWFLPRALLFNPLGSRDPTALRSG